MSHDPSPIFVVGTGRCGSTLLSAMLREHPGIASLSEVFSFVTDLGGRIRETFPEHTLDGAAFWHIVGGVHPKTAMLLRHGLVMDEVLFRPRPGGRYSFETGVPALLHTALPHLFDDPETILDEVRSFVLSRPPASAADHYRALFTWLARRIDRRTWVERSGGSLRIVARLLRAFPDARFVHIVRDGRDAAISMSRHHGFRMALFSAQLTEILGVDPYEDSDRTQEADVPDDLLPYLPERFDPEAFRAADVPLGLCGHYWSGECVAGVGELGRVAPGRVRVVRFEDLLRAPAEVLAGLQRFLDPEFADPEWPARMALRVGRPRSSWRDLPPRAQRELNEACRAGFEALGGLYPVAESA